jgi:alpha-L-fucosidase
MKPRLTAAAGVLIVLLAALSFACSGSKQPAEKSREDVLRFGLVTDIHYADAVALGPRHYRQSTEKLRAVVAQWNAEGLDFAVELGDFKDQNVPPDGTKTLAYLGAIESVFGEFRGPRHHVLGNHDLDSLTKTQFLETITNPGIAKDRSFYSFSAKGVRFFVLDACFKSDGTPFDRGDFKWEDANIPEPELAWLETELAASSEPAVVFIHQQLEGEGAYFVKNAPAVRKVLEDSGKVLAVFQGHRHEGMFHWTNGIPYYTLKAMIEGAGGEDTSSAVVEIDGRRNVRVRGYGRADSLALLAPETAAEHDARMKWWREARFGLFIHWGLYAIPAGAWGGKTHYGEWIRHNAQIPIGVYDQFVGRFNPVKFDAREWVRTAKDAGMGYIVITSKHHDGFCLFDSKQTDFDVMSTPFRRDIIKELSDACREAGIVFCFYHSIMDWHHPDYLPRRPWEKDRSAKGADLDRYVEHMKSQLRELLINYGDIGVVWFDGEWEETWTESRGRDLYHYVRGLQPKTIINNRVGASRSGMEGFSSDKESAGDFGTPEQQIPATGLPGLDWETCLTMNDNWGYNALDRNWKSATDLIRKLADIASKGGNFLLNVGPTAEGLFPAASVERLAEIGRWMKTNGESIRSTQASPFKAPSWGRCTRKAVDGGARLYLHVFDWPADGRLVVAGILNEPARAFLLADSDKSLDVTRAEDALTIRVPAAAPDPADSVVVLDVSGALDVSDPPRVEADFEIFTETIEVNIASDRANVEIRYTIDGSDPTATSTVVAGPVRLSDTAVVSARSFRNGKAVSGAARAKFVKVAPRPAKPAVSTQPGLAFAFFRGEWDVLPEFSKLKPEGGGVVPRIDISKKPAKENYGFEFSGFIRVPKDGGYAFFLSSDDGSRLFIGDDLVVDNDGLHGMQERRGVAALAAGLHPIRIGFFNRTGGEGLTVSWQGPDFSKQPIPAGAFFSER